MPRTLPDDAPARNRSRVTSALRHRDFALLWSGQAVSLAGDGMFTVALPLEVLRQTGNPVALAVVIGARTLPAVLLLLAGGALVDRFSRRLVMLISDAVCGATVGLAGILIAVGHTSIWQLAVLTFIFGVASAFFKPASSAIVPQVLPPEMLLSASSLSSMSQSIAKFLVGPLVGGVLTATTGTAWAFGVDAISFAVSATFLALMRPTPRLATSAEPSRLVEEIREGLRYCRSQPWLWWSMIAVGIAYVACYAPIGILIPLLVKDGFGGGAIALGALYAASGVGGALAAAVAGRWPTRRPMLSIWLAWSGVGIAAIALAAVPWLWLGAIFTACIWFGTTYGNVHWHSLMQRDVRPDMLGRASSVDWALSLGLTPVGTFFAGVAVAAYGVRPTLVVGGVVTAATVLVLLLPGVTDPDRRIIEAADEISDDSEVMPVLQ